MTSELEHPDVLLRRFTEDGEVIEIFAEHRVIPLVGF